MGLGRIDDQLSYSNAIFNKSVDSYPVKKLDSLYLVKKFIYFPKIEVILY
jgi:hypothetical protein